MWDSYTCRTMSSPTIVVVSYLWPRLRQTSKFQRFRHLNGIYFNTYWLEGHSLERIPPPKSKSINILKPHPGKNETPLWKSGKMILDLDQHQSQNITECSLTQGGLPLPKFHELSSTTFSVILFNVWKRPISPCWKVEKLILDPGPEPDQSQNLIDSFLAHPHPFHPPSFMKIGPQLFE